MKIEYNGNSINIEEGVIAELNRYIDEKKAEYAERQKNMRLMHLSMKKRRDVSCSIRRPSGSGIKLEERMPAMRGQSSFSAAEDLDALVKKRKKTFQEALFDMIDKTGMTDSEVYRRADIDRRHFSKIRNNRDYHPTKRTALALVIALKLNIDEATDLLRRAGYALSNSNTADIIVRYCINTGIYDLMEVNGLLWHYDQPLLGGQI